MNFKKSKRYSNFNYIPRFYDEGKVNWKLRKSEIKRKVLEENHSYEDFIQFSSEKSKSSKIRKMIILGGILGIFFTIPIYYGMGIFQLCIMMFLGTGFVKMSNILK
jgi:hypothetical protein